MKSLIRRVSLIELSYALNLSRTTIKKWCKKLNIQVIKGKIYVEDLDIIIKDRL